MLETARKTVSGFRIARMQESGSARRRNDALGAAVSAAGPAVPFPPPWGGRSPPYSPAGSGSVPRPLCLLARRGYLHPSPTALSH